MTKYMPFSPVEIVFTMKKEAIEYLESLVSNKEKTLLLASEGRISELGLGKWLLNTKSSSDIIHIKQIPSNPTVSDVYNILKMLQGTHPGRIIAIGGGSCIDIAKAISALYYQIPTELLSVQSVRSAIKDKKYIANHHFIDIIAVPTTSGTGSEVTKWATIWDMEQKEKLSVDCADIFPKVALLVPEFTTTMPESLTLSTGLDALSHAMEAFWARSTTPLSKTLAITAIEYVKDYLPQVLLNGNDIELRKGMCLASLISGLAFSITRTTACHSISYPLTMYYGMDHGFAAAITLAEVADRNEAVVNDIYRIYSVFGSKRAFRQWIKDITLPVQELKLSAFGISQADLDFIVEKTCTQGRMDNNPILFSQSEVKTILQQVL